MNKKALVAVLIVVVVLLGGYGLSLLGSRVPPGDEGDDSGYSPTRDFVTHQERIPNNGMLSFLILGQTPDVLDGKSAERDGWLASQITFTTATPQTNLFAQYQELFTNTGWQIDNSIDDANTSSFSVRRYTESAAVVIETRDGRSFVRIDLMQRVAARTSPL